MFPPKTRADAGMVRTCKVYMAKPPGGKKRMNKEEDQSMQQGGGLVHAKPRSLTCADFEYNFTIPTSANILPHLRSSLLPFPVFPPAY